MGRGGGGVGDGTNVSPGRLCVDAAAAAAARVVGGIFASFLFFIITVFFVRADQESQMETKITNMHSQKEKCLG